MPRVTWLGSGNTKISTQVLGPKSVFIAPVSRSFSNSPNHLLTSHYRNMRLTSHVSNNQVKSKDKDKETLILTFIFLGKRGEGMASQKMVGNQLITVTTSKEAIKHPP